MSARLEAIKEQIATNIAGFQPVSRSDADAWFRGLPDLLQTFGSAFASAAENIAAMPNMPFDSAVIDMVRDLGSVISGAAGPAEDTYNQHAKAHEGWLTD